MSWIHVYCRVKWQEWQRISFNDLASSILWLLSKNALLLRESSVRAKKKGLLKILNLAEPFYPVDKLMARQDCALFTLPSSLPFFFPFFHPSFLLALLPFLSTFLPSSLASLPPFFPSFLSFIYLSGHLRIHRSNFVTNKRTKSVGK